MMDSLIGRFAISKAGHDKCQVYVIIDENAEHVSLCDGRLKAVTKPKKKRIKHIQLTNSSVNKELLQKLLCHDKILDEEIKYELKRFYASRN